MTGRRRFIRGDQSTRDLSARSDIDPAHDIVLLVEARYVRQHKQKIAFLLSVMRHFAQDLRAERIRVV